MLPMLFSTTSILVSVLNSVLLLPAAPPAAEAARGAPTDASAAQWPRFRGPGGLGVTPASDVPVEFDGKLGKGICWKAPVALPGPSSPILWDGRIYVTGADADRRAVFAFDAASGKSLWQAEIPAAAGGAQKNLKEDDAEDDETILAGSTPAADGKRIFAIFGTGDVAAVDPEGKVLWSRGLGRPVNAYGHASSLEIWRDRLIVQLDQGEMEDKKSKLLALDASTGRTVWEAPRPVPASWSTPITVAAEGREEIIACGGSWVMAHDPATGAELWRAKCLGGEVVPSPVFAGGLVIAAAVDGKLAAIRPGGKGDVTADRIVWESEDDLPSIACPLATGELVITASSGGFVVCCETGTGKRLWTKDFETNFLASPVLAGGTVIFIDENGVLSAFKAARTYEPVARSELGEPCQATPMPAPGRLYIRGRKHLYAIGPTER